MKIVDIRESTRPIKSDIRNAYIDFSKMTLSLVAVVTDVIRDGKPVIGYGFNSNGRYGQGALIRERFIARVLEAEPASLSTTAARQPRPAQGLGHADDQREARRPRRALGRGRHDRHGGLGRGGQDRGQAAVPAARRALRPATAKPNRGVRLRRRRLLLPGPGPRGPGARDAQLPRPRLLGGQDEDRRRVAGRGLQAHRGGAEDCWAPASSWRSMPTAASTCRPRSTTPRRCRSTTCSGTRKPAIRSTTRCRPSWRSTTPADGHRREPVLDAGCAQPDPLRRHAPRPRLAAVRLRARATAWSSTCARSTC